MVGALCADESHHQQARLEIRQGLLGWLLDAGSVAQQVGGERIVARVAQLRALQRLIADRRPRLLGLAEQPSLPRVARRPLVMVVELERNLG
ncbi:MAG: hypothetical protein HGA45_15110 [Chloroflexales bacterium]|nr:hypothetical protein [Chloroflexales bacterium]